MNINPVGIKFTTMAPVNIPKVPPIAPESCLTPVPVPLRSFGRSSRVISREIPHMPKNAMPFKVLLRRTNGKEFKISSLITSNTTEIGSRIVHKYAIRFRPIRSDKTFSI